MVKAATYSSITAGNIRITYLPDGYILFDPTAVFPTTTAADWQFYWKYLDDDGQLVGSLGAYLLQTPDQTILVDTGLGPIAYESTASNAMVVRSSPTLNVRDSIPPTSISSSSRTCTQIM